MMAEDFMLRCFLCGNETKTPVECGGCNGAVHFCSDQHREFAISQGHDCSRCRQSVELQGVNSFPFTWVPTDAAHPSTCTLMQQLGVHGKGGPWARECFCSSGIPFGAKAPLLQQLWLSCTSATITREALASQLKDWWGVSVEGVSELLTSSVQSAEGAPVINDWMSYCQQRPLLSTPFNLCHQHKGENEGEEEEEEEEEEEKRKGPSSEEEVFFEEQQLPKKKKKKSVGVPAAALSSPLPILLDAPLTIYHAVNRFRARSKDGQLPPRLVICVPGVEKEIDQWPFLLELGALLPSTDIVVQLVGVEVPLWADNRSITIPHPQQSTPHSMIISFHRGYLGNVLLCDALSAPCDTPDIIVGLNAGLGAYPAWRGCLETVQSLMQRASKPNVVVFTDYVAESIYIARECVKSVFFGPTPQAMSQNEVDEKDEFGEKIGEVDLRSRLRLSECAVNPFRKPSWVRQAEHSMPHCPNGFIFWLELDV